MANRRDPHWFKFGEDYATTASGDGDSAPIVTRHLKNLMIQVDGEFQADITVKTRLDPSLSYLDLVTLSAPGFVAVPNDASMSDVTVVVSGYVSGSIRALLVGRTSQE
jgi:hypothetical protein